MILFGIVLFWFGAAIGSFLNVVILRYNTETLGGRSHCPACKRTLVWWELIPILSFIGLRGKCRTCNAPLALQYPLVELFMGSAALSIFLPQATNAQEMAAQLLILAITATLLVLAVIDARTYVLPDRHIIIVTLAVFALALVKDKSIAAALGGAAIGTGLLLGVWIATSGKGIGLGDVKIMVPLGALLGPLVTPVMLLCAFTGGACIGVYLLMTRRATMKTPIPFGPYLIGATGAVTLMPQISEQLIKWIIG